MRGHRIVGIVAVLVLASLAGGGCEHQGGNRTVPPADSVRPAGPSQETRDARFTLHRDGRRRAIIAAAWMGQYERNDTTYSVWRPLPDSGRVRSYVFDPKGDSSATIVADSVVFYGQQGRYEAYGDVVVTTDEGRRLESEHLTWYQRDRTIRTRRFVRITTPTETVRGNGLVADEDLQTYQIGRFNAEVEVDDES